MLECRACTWRAIRAIAGDASSLTAPSSLLTRPLALTPPPILKQQPHQRRRLATAAPLSTNKPAAEDALSHLQAEDTAPTTTNKSGSIVIQDEQALRQELIHLKDPVKLAEHVKYTLRRGKPENALDLCRLASNDLNAVVSWNHVIDWHVQKDKLNHAIKILNEMKKRGQFPDSYTYTRIFAGISSNHRDAIAKGRVGRGESLRKKSASKALAIYNGMFSPTSRVKPTIIHTNSVLRICSLARDIDGVWGVAGNLAESGPGSANTITYSILLGAIRHCAKYDFESGGTGQQDKLVDDEARALHAQKNRQALNDGKRVWQEVISKWRKAEIVIDEQLVVSMAKLLLMSKRMEDLDDVLNLVQQTTRVERLVAPLGSPERHSQHVPSIQDREALEEDQDGWVATLTPDVFKSVNPAGNEGGISARSTSLVWVQPGNGILNVVIEACSNMREPKTAQAYWDKLTTEYAVKPDLSNFQEILGLLKLNHSSARAIYLVKDMHAQGMEVRHKTYRLAMATCQRDHKNQNIVDITTRLLDDMEKHLPYPDVSILDSYLNLALQKAEGPKIVAALNRLDTFVHVLRSRVTFGAEGDEQREASIQIKDKEVAVTFLRSMIGAIDTLMQRGFVPREDFKHWHARRSQINSFVGKAINNVRDQRRNIDRKVEQRMKYFEMRLDSDEVDKEMQEQGRSFTRAGRAAYKMKLENQYANGRDASSPSAGEAPVVPQRERIAQIRKWRVDEMQERLESLKKWRLPQSDAEWDRAKLARYAYADQAEDKYPRRAQDRAAREKALPREEVQEFEFADSPMDLAMK